MNGAQFMALAPLVVLAVGIVALMTQIAIRRNARISLAITLATLVLAIWGALADWPAAPQSATPLLVVDAYARIFTILVLGAALLTAVLSDTWMRPLGAEQHEYFLLLLLGSFGAAVLCHAVHLASFILGLETLGIALYAMIAYPDKSWLPIEAGLKYLVLSSASTAILLFGFALLYAAGGALDFAGMAASFGSGAGLLTGAAAVMILAGFAFKLSLVPFHMWTPDVYEGAPTPVTGFLATVSKAAIFVVLLRWFHEAGLARQPAMLDALALLAAASMLVGNLLALRQEDLKRLLGYSSIAHMGYLLVALVVCGHSATPALALEAAAYYVLAYAVSTLAAFAALGALHGLGWPRDACRIDDVRGLFWREPLLALVLGAALLSLAGIPLTVGFVAKFYVVAAGAEAGLWGLLAALVVGSAIGVYYYLRVLYAMSVEAEGALPAASAIGLRLRAVCIVLVVLVLYLGVYPQPLIASLRGIL